MGTRFGVDWDNIQVLHAFRAFSSRAPQPDGTVRENVTGTTLGEEARLLAAWHVGGCSMALPPDVGLELPGPDQRIMVQWHVYNATGMAQLDASRVQICTVAAGTRPHTASMTFLGTENLGGLEGLPTGWSEWSSSCTNASDEPVTLVAFRPHMHFLGVSMRSDVLRLDGTREAIFDEDFQFDYQIHYPLDPRPVIGPAETIDTTCEYFNDTGQGVPFGEATQMEMCYQMAYAYPPRILEDPGGLSLIGALDVCLGGPGS